MSADETAGGRRMVGGGEHQRAGGAESDGAGAWLVNGVASLQEL